MNPIEFITPEQELYLSNINNINISRGALMIAHLADLHFGALDPKYQYETLCEQFLNKISDIKFDILAINGDLFDRKSMSNSETVMYSTLFIGQCVQYCINTGATLIIIHGTEEHDAGQLKLFYHYLETPGLDIRIVERTRFEYVKGAKILCIPEEYDKGEEYYNHFLHNSGMYDLVLMHGMFKGAIYQDKDLGLDSNRAPIFRIEDFVNCKGCIISGHIHTPGCFNGYFYYCGSPYRWQFGEEHDKGFLITLHNLDTGGHYVHFERINSMKFVTINIDNIITKSPEEIINYVKDLKTKQNIDYLRLEILNVPNEECLATVELIKKYFRNNNTIKIKNEVNKNKEVIQQNNEFLDKYKEYDFILDKSLSEYEILTRYINKQKGYLYITTDELIDLLTEE